MRSMGLGTAVFAATLFAGSLMAAEVAPVCSNWDVVATPNSGKGSDLRSVDALNASNVWAVGQSRDASSTRDGAPVAMRWDGSTWTAEPLPDLTYLGTQPTLEAVGIAPTGDPWVVGHLRDTSGTDVELILRWSGGLWETHRVAMVDSFAPRYALLRDVAAIAINDAWAVGEATTQVKGAIEPFAAHWDGTAWSEVTMPGTVVANRVLTAVSAAASNAVWAVGYDVDPLAKNTSYARIYRWDGSLWTVVDQPAAAKPGSALHDIVALAADDIWAVGAIGTDAGLFLHWDGTTWTSHPAPLMAAPRSVDGVASNDVWAAGANGNYHWDGIIWTFVPLSTEVTSARRVLAVAGPCDVWSVSSSSDATGDTSSKVERLGPPVPAQDPPMMPVGFVATPKSSYDIVLEWLPGSGDPTGSVGQTGFVIERCAGDIGDCQTQFSVIQKVGGKVTSYSDSGLKPASFYTYRIYAVNEAGKSDTTTPATALTLAEAGTSTLPVPARARAPRVSETSPFSIPLPPQRGTPPAMPVGFVVKPATSKEIGLGWMAGDDPTGPIVPVSFVIERCINGAGATCEARFAVIQKLPGNVTSFTDSGLQPATAYTYRVYAVNDSGASDATVPATASTFAAASPSPLPEPTNRGTLRPAPPATPTAFIATPQGPRRISLQWVSGGDPTGAAGQAGFVIERCIGEAGACQTRFTVIGKAGAKATSLVDFGLQPATSYTYRMYAINEAGKSDATAPETATTFPPESPRGRTAPGPRP